MAGDSLFAYVEKLQGARPWGSVLDAGTGVHSLKWVAGLPTTRWAAVCADPGIGRKLEERFASKMRPVDRIVSGNWLDPLFLLHDVYDVVLADYLLGALDGFSPYFQDRLFGRLRPHVGSRLYLIGLAPYPDSSEHPWGSVLLEIARLRDACILLAGHRCYREYPLDWTLRHLESSGFVVEEARVFPIRYGSRFVNEQLDVCRQKLPYLEDRQLAAQLETSVEELREKALALHSIHSGATFGDDYVVCARPT